MRKSFDGLCGLVSGQLHQNPMSGDIFVFINKQRNRVKLLRWEPGGFVLFYKRLERGTFELPSWEHKALGAHLEYAELAMIVSGISLRNAKKRTRFFQKNIVNK
jgi:transposase